MQAVSLFVAGLTVGVALPYLWFAVDARRKPKR